MSANGHQQGEACRQFTTHWHGNDGRIYWSQIEREPAGWTPLPDGAGKLLAAAAREGPIGVPPEPEPVRISGNGGKTRGPLTAAQQAVLAPYIRTVADRLNLRDWLFKLDDDMVPTSSDTMARVETTYGRFQAQLWFRDDLADQEPKMVRLVVTHELVHVHDEAIGHLLDATIKGQIGMAAWDVFVEAYRLLREQACDALADAIAPSMPEFPGWTPAP